MAISKNFRSLKTNELGQEMIFNYLAFKQAVDERAQNYEREYTQKRGGKEKVIREIASILDPENPESYRHCIKQWFHGNNSPSRLEDVEVMEEYLNTQLLKVKDTLQLKKPERHGYEEMDVEYKCPDKNSVEKSAQEREVAKAVYELMADLIRVHKKLMISYSHSNPSIIIGDHSDLPEEYPIYDDLRNKVKKLSFDLPKDVRTNVQRLLSYIYGYNVHFERIDGFYEMLSEINAYDDFVKVQRHRKENDMGMIYWHEFALEQEDEYYHMLDDVFQQYLID